MLHPDLIEEMDYAANAHYDYIREAYGDLGDSPEQCEAEFYWDYEADCDVRDIPTVRELRYETHAQDCVRSFIFAVIEVCQGKDWIPF